MSKMIIIVIKQTFPYHLPQAYLAKCMEKIQKEKERSFKGIGITQYVLNKKEEFRKNLRKQKL